MRHALFGLAFLALAGCDSLLQRCAPEACAPGSCPGPQMEVQSCEQVVQAPRQKIVVETQAPAAPAQAPQATPPQATPPQAASAPQQAPPQMMPQMAPQMMPQMMSYGQPMAAPFVPVNAAVRERTGLGLAFDTIHIPIPILRFIPVQRPAELSFQMPLSAPMAQTGFAAPMTPMMMPAQGFQAMPMAGFAQPMSGFAQPNVAMVPQATLNYGQVTVQSQVPVQQQGSAQLQLNAQQLAALQAALAGQNPASAPPSAATLQAQLEECQKKVKQLEELKAKKDEKDKEPTPKPSIMPPSE
jgi:hypothetical protein